MAEYLLEDIEDPGDEGCGYSWDHTIRRDELDDSHWECMECGAEGWDEDAPA